MGCHGIGLCDGVVGGVECRMWPDRVMTFPTAWTAQAGAVHIRYRHADVFICMPVRLCGVMRAIFWRPPYEASDICADIGCILYGFMRGGGARRLRSGMLWLPIVPARNEG